MAHHKIPIGLSTLSQSWRHDWKSIFIPHRFEMGMLAALALAGHYACGYSWPEVAWGCFKFFCAFRVWGLMYWIWERLSPRTYEKSICSPLFWFGLVGLFFAPTLWRLDWQSLSQMRPSWHGALWTLGFAVLAVLFFWLPMWSLDKIFKPYAARTGQNVLGALGFLTLSSVCWLGLVFGIYTFFG